MDYSYHRYPSAGIYKYNPGSKGLNVHYKLFREGPYGITGKRNLGYKILHKQASVGQFVDQHGASTFAYKIPSLKTWKTAPFMDRLPRGGEVPRIVGELGDDDGPVSPELIAQPRGEDLSSHFVIPSFEHDTNYKDDITILSGASEEGLKRFERFDPTEPQWKHPPPVQGV